jgi:hypothetical protein
VRRSNRRRDGQRGSAAPSEGPVGPERRAHRRSDGRRPRCTRPPRAMGRGMVLANRPWKMLPAFKGAIAAAFATGAYALVVPPIWLLADAAGWARLLLLMAVALVAMVGWIVVAHNLWERPEDPEQRRWAALYNGVTVLTVSAAVLAAYAILRPPSSTLSASGST